VVDTHAHIYHADESTYPMIEDPSRPPEGTGTIEHLRKNVAYAGISRVVLVQTGSAYRWDNRLLGDTAKANDDWTVGVCTLNPSSRESITELERLRTGFNVRGVRVEPTRSDYPQFYHPGSVALWEAAQRLDVVVCAHLQSQYLQQLSDLLARFPDVPVVLDHAAYPKAAAGVDSETVNAVVDLARFDQLHVKLTFAVTGSGENFPFADMHGIVRKILRAYGPDRCMWGSDFPCEHWLKKSTYIQHLDLFRKELGLSAGEESAVLSETATRLWFS
jgi:predicted TIM-barrel fold metal-dependent hydrolase